MPLLRYLQHWLTGRGPCIHVLDFVPETHPRGSGLTRFRGPRWWPPWNKVSHGAFLPRPHEGERR